MFTLDDINTDELIQQNSNDVLAKIMNILEKPSNDKLTVEDDNE